MSKMKIAQWVAVYIAVGVIGALGGALYQERKLGNAIEANVNERKALHDILEQVASDKE